MDVGGGCKKKTNKKPSDVLDICFRFDLNFGFQVHFSFMFCKSLVSFFTLQIFLQTHSSKCIGENFFVRVTSLIMVP